MPPTLGSALVALVVAAVADTGLPGGGTARAQVNELAEVISRAPGGGGPWTTFNTDASISADGRFVVFNSSPPAPVNDMETIRDASATPPSTYRWHRARTARSATTAV